MPHGFPALRRFASPSAGLAAALLLGSGLTLLASGPARTQSYYPPQAYGSPGSPPPAYGQGSAYAPSGMLPPPQVQSIVRNMGFSDVGRPYLQGRTYFLPAMGGGGPLTLAVDAFTGRVSTVGVKVYGIPFYEPPAPPRSYSSRTPPGQAPAPAKPKPMPGGSQMAAPPPQSPQPPPLSDVPVAPAPGTPNPVAPPVAPPDPAAAAAPATAPTGSGPGARPAEAERTPGGASPQPSDSASPAPPPAPAGQVRTQGPAETSPAPQASPQASPQVSPQVSPQASTGTGSGSATPGDGVSAGSPSVLSRGLAPQGAN